MNIIIQFLFRFINPSSSELKHEFNRNFSDSFMLPTTVWFIFNTRVWGTCRFSYTIYYGPASFIISTLSGRDGRLDSLPTVGYLTPDTFQTISLSDIENLKTGRRTARTTSVRNHQFHACHWEECKCVLISSWENLKPLRKEWMNIEFGRTRGEQWKRYNVHAWSSTSQESHPGIKSLISSPLTPDLLFHLHIRINSRNPSTYQRFREGG